MIILFFSNSLYSRSQFIFLNFHHVEILTDNASETKSDIVKLISIKSLVINY